MEKSLLVAIGGNSLIRAGQKGTIDQQIGNARFTAGHLADLAARGYRMVITHGNGPQVGSQLLRSEIASSQTYPLPLDVCVGMTEGEIGYILLNEIRSALDGRHLRIPVASFITTVVVDGNDEAFLRPSKPIGPFYSREVAERRGRESGWTMVEDASRGYRRVVPSPKPLCVLELDVIRACVDKGFIVIAAGGGGVPVVRDNGALKGVEAVIDKDRVSVLLALQLRLRRLVIATDVEHVYVNYKKPDQQAVPTMNLVQARQLLEANEFAEGSMKPKIEAAVEFLTAGGKEVIVTDAQHLTDAVGGLSGTRITA